MKKIRLLLLLLSGSIPLIHSAAGSTVSPTKTMVYFLVQSREKSFVQRSLEIQDLTDEELDSKIMDLYEELTYESCRGNSPEKKTFSDDLRKDLQEFYVDLIRSMLKNTYTYALNQTDTSKENALADLKSADLRQFLSESSKLRSLTNIFFFERHIQQQLNQNVDWEKVHREMDGINIFFIQNLISYRKIKGAKILFNKTDVGKVAPFLEAYKAPAVAYKDIFHQAFESIEVDSAVADLNS